MATEKPRISKEGKNWQIRWEGYVVMLCEGSKGERPNAFVTQDHPLPLFSSFITFGR